MLTPEQIGDVANYVVSLSGGEGDDAAAAERGKQLYAENECAACHGDDGKGNKELGGPNLTDKIWLYGGSIEAREGPGDKAAHGRHAGLGRALDEPRSSNSLSTSIRSAAARRRGAVTPKIGLGGRACCGEHGARPLDHLQ